MMQHARVLHQYRERCLSKRLKCSDASFGFVADPTKNEGICVQFRQGLCRDNGCAHHRVYAVDSREAVWSAVACTFVNKTASAQEDLALTHFMMSTALALVVRSARSHSRHVIMSVRNTVLHTNNR